LGLGALAPSDVQLFEVNAYVAWKNKNPADHLKAVPKKARRSMQASTVIREKSETWVEAKADILDSFYLLPGEELVRVEPKWVFCVLKGAPEDLEPKFLAKEVGRLIDLAESIEA
jgi:hypothetical protein